MNNVVHLNQPVNKELKEHPELLDILVDLGFKPLSNPVMRQSLGNITTLKQGCQFLSLSLDELKETLNNHGYEISE